MRVLPLISSASHSVLFCQPSRCLGMWTIPAVGGAALADGDRFGDDVRSGLVGGVDHLGAGVLVLAVVGQGDRDDLAAGPAALEDDARVFHRQAGADVAVDPLDLGVLVRDAALGDEVEDIAAQFWTVMHWIFAPFMATMKGAKIQYITVQNWATNVFNLVTKRGVAHEDAEIKWIDCNIGSRLTMKYPGVVLKGRKARGEVISIALANDGQHQDTGAKMIHAADETTSNIIAKSISVGQGRSTYRGVVHIPKHLKGCKNNTECDALLINTNSRTDTYPAITVRGDRNATQHEASVSKVSEEHDLLHAAARPHRGPGDEPRRQRLHQRPRPPVPDGILRRAQAADRPRDGRQRRLTPWPCPANPPSAQSRTCGRLHSRGLRGATRAPSRRAGVVARAQARRLRRFASLPMPSRTDEGWRFSNIGTLSPPLYVGGVYDPSGVAMVDPARLAWGLRRACLELGVRVHERSPVLGMHTDRTASPVRLQSANGTVDARRVALATSAFPPLLNRIRQYVVPVYDYALMTEPLSDQQRASIGWKGRQGIGDSGNQFHYLRLTADDRILFGGYDAVYHWRNGFGRQFERRQESFEVLAEHFFQTFPQLEGVRFTHQWGGAIDTCARFCAFWGTAHAGRVAYSTGYTGLGVGREPLRCGCDARSARRQRDRTDQTGDGSFEAAAVPARAAPQRRHQPDPMVAGPSGSAGRPSQHLAARARSRRPWLRLLTCRARQRRVGFDPASGLADRRGVRRGRNGGEHTVRISPGRVVLPRLRAATSLGLRRPAAVRPTGRSRLVGSVEQPGRAARFARSSPARQQSSWRR